MEQNYVTVTLCIRMLQSIIICSTGLLVLAQAYTVCCGDRVPANLQQQQHRALQQERRMHSCRFGHDDDSIYSGCWHNRPRPILAHCCVTRARVADLEPPPPPPLLLRPCQQTHTASALVDRGRRAVAAAASLLPTRCPQPIALRTWATPAT